MLYFLPKSSIIPSYLNSLYAVLLSTAKSEDYTNHCKAVSDAEWSINRIKCLLNCGSDATDAVKIQLSYLDLLP